MKAMLVIVKDGRRCTFAKCRPGFFVYNDRLCLKSEYGQEAFVESGEMFWGGVSTAEKRDELLVQPVNCVTIKLEEGGR